MGTYYDIGHSDDSAMLWVWSPRKGFDTASRRLGRHSDIWDIDEHTWRGRFDPHTKKCSVTVPMILITRRHAHIPDALIEALENEFGEIEIEAFNPPRRVRRSAYA